MDEKIINLSVRKEHINIGIQKIVKKFQTSILEILEEKAMDKPMLVIDTETTGRD
jgi:hypothetical protein